MDSSSESHPDATPADEHEAYERECLREVREQLTRVLAHPHEQHELRDARLEGAYPDTTIVVELWDGRFDKAAKKSYAIWRTPVFVAASGVREAPNQVGMLITTWSLGG